MPPKVKITKESIIQTAVELVRTNGEEAINARAIAAALQCSTQPIFSNFATMQDLRDAVIAAAYERYAAFLAKESERGEYPTYKSYGMAYIRFAQEERVLFRLLFMRDRTGEDLSPTLDFEQAVRMMQEASGVSHERAMLMHLELWSCVHGIAVMLATSFLPLEWETISGMLTDVYMGIRARHTKED